MVSLAPDAEAARAALASNSRKAAPLFKKAADGQDTLEVFVLYVQFKDETATDDVSTTTGLGTFGSAGQGPADSDKKQAYTLDPNGNLRRYRFYLEKHFEFAKDYFEQGVQGTRDRAAAPLPPPRRRRTHRAPQARMHHEAVQPLRAGQGRQAEDQRLQRGAGPAPHDLRARRRHGRGRQGQRRQPLPGGQGRVAWRQPGIAAAPLLHDLPRRPQPAFGRRAARRLRRGHPQRFHRLLRHQARFQLPGHRPPRTAPRAASPTRRCGATPWA